MQDPNPLVSGAGFRRLEGSGVKLSLGLREAEARKLNEPFCKYITTRRPFVTLKAGMTLDGKIAGNDGRSKWITSEDSRRRVQQLRFETDAILAGIGTVLTDDPLLTDRSRQRRRRPLLRVILDSGLRLPLESKLVRSRYEGDIILFCSQEREISRQRRLEEKGIEVFPVPVSQEKISLHSVLDELGRREITSLLIEGGSAVNFEALDSQSVDRVIFFVSPKILGGKEAVPVVGGRGFQDLEKSLQLTFTDVERIGPDLVIEACFDKSKVPETS
jgi:diaminohydroxyphosphoribosylaminopyrimidine deaminase/5-amino-6-(5-phosphoribosylamino)uracil reductase